MKVTGQRHWRGEQIAALRDSARPAAVEVDIDYRITITAPLGASIDELYEAARQADRLRRHLIEPNRDERADRNGARACDYIGLGWSYARIVEGPLAPELAHIGGPDPVQTALNRKRQVQRWVKRWRERATAQVPWNRRVPPSGDG